MSSARYQVRTGDAADLIDVVQLEREMQQAPHWSEAEYAAITNAVEGFEVPVRRRLFVAEVDERLIGFAVGRVLISGGLTLAELEIVVVSISQRRRGVGRALCEKVISWSREQAAVEMELEVRAGSEGAIALYVELGFLPVGKRVRYYSGPVEDALLMQLNLAEYK
jgi:ribosomal-protein-alanine N-acetyltransferase